MTSMPYINDACGPSDELQTLRNHPLIQDFASVSDDTYSLILATNPMLGTFMKLAKRIVEGDYK
nr:hypothetical protein [uncultured Methanolobus sp.]